MTTSTNKAHRCRVRATRFGYLQAVDFLCKSHTLADAPAVPGSLDIVFGKVGR